MNNNVWFGFSVQKKDGTTESLSDPSVHVPAGNQGGDSKGNVISIKVIVQSLGALCMLDYCKFCNYMHILITVYDFRMLKFACMIISATVKYSLTSKFNVQICQLQWPSDYVWLVGILIFLCDDFEFFSTSFKTYRLIRHSVIKNYNLWFLITECLINL